MAKAEDIARLWAEQAPKGPMVAGTFSRWSDHYLGHHGTAIAHIVDTPDGGKAALIGLHGWSYGVNTSMLANLALSYAKKSGLPTFTVKHIEIARHADNLANYDWRIGKLEEKVTRARNKDAARALVEAMREERRLYSDTFKVA